MEDRVTQEIAEMMASEKGPAEKICRFCNQVFKRPTHAAGIRQWAKKTCCSERCRRNAKHAEKYVTRVMAGPNLNEMVERLLENDDARILPNDERYAVSKNGRVFSRAKWGHSTLSPVWREMSTFIRKKESGYLAVPLGWGNVWFVHQLVLLAFKGPMPKDLQVRHLDGNPQNNNLGNLCYGSAKENAEDRERHKAAKKRTSPQ